MYEGVERINCWKKETVQSPPVLPSLVRVLLKLSFETATSHFQLIGNHRLQHLSHKKLPSCWCQLDDGTYKNGKHASETDFYAKEGNTVSRAATVPMYNNWEEIEVKKSVQS